MRQMKIIASTMLVIGLCGCAASIRTTELRGGEKTISGLPFKMRDMFVIELYQRTPKGYQKVAEKTELLADPARTYALEFEGQPLATTKIQVGLYPDSTLKDTSLDSESQADEALSAVGGGIKGAATSYADLEKARKAAAKAEAGDTETDLTKRYSSNLALSEAITAVQVAEQELLELSADEPASRRVLKQGQIAALKLKANEAARRAGLTEMPY